MEHPPSNHLHPEEQRLHLHLRLDGQRRQRHSNSSNNQGMFHHQLLLSTIMDHPPLNPLHREEHRQQQYLLLLLPIHHRHPIIMEWRIE